MTTLDLDVIKSQLVELREDLSSQLVERGAHPDDSSVDEPEDEAGFADAAQTTAERDKSLALIDRLREQLSSVEGALSALAAGTYGQCAKCGTEIPSERLEALPYVTLCVSCKKSLA